MSIKSDKWITRNCVHPSRLNLRAEHSPQGVPYGMYTPPDVVEQDITKSFTSGDLHPEWKPMIEPFEYEQVRFRKKEQSVFQRDRNIHPGSEKVISYGVSSYGYDVRCADEFKIFTNVNSSVVDPKSFDDGCYVDKKAEDGFVIIPPNGFALARTVEYFRIPREVLVVCLGKSTYARCGIIVNVTPLEPEWEGHVTLEFSNTTSLPAKIYANEGCAQFLFIGGDEPCEISYKDRGGKYMGQTGITLPKA